MVTFVRRCFHNVKGIVGCDDHSSCYDIKPVWKEEGKSYWKIPLRNDDATREK